MRQRAARSQAERLTRATRGSMAAEWFSLSVHTWMAIDTSSPGTYRTQLYSFVCMYKLFV